MRDKKPPQKNPKNKTGRSFFTWLLIFMVISTISGFFTEGVNPKNEINFSEFLSKVESNEVASVIIKDTRIIGKLKNNQEFSTYTADYPDLVNDLKKKNVIIKALPLVTQRDKAVAFLLGWMPFLVIIGLWWYFFMRSSGGGGGPMKFAKSKAKLINKMNGIITFKDVAGIDEAREEIVELVDFLKDHEKYIKIGAKIPKGCLLVGAPGTGKTLLARAIAGEAGVPFFFISGSDFVEMFVGVGASRVRDMFAEAKKNSPCIVFIDEIDAVGRHRGIGVGGGNDEREQTLNQLLVEMDGFEDNEGVIIIAATNRPDVLDKALTRPGRFDRQVIISLPDIKGREEILQVHSKNVNLAPDVELRVIAKSTPGFSGAELANVINEAALLAAKHNKKCVTMREVEEACDKIIMGVARKNRLVKDDEKKLTAYHEAGHAIMAFYCKYSDPIHKVTIIQRGQALGYVSMLPEDDKVSKTRGEILDNIAIAMGGRVTEEMMFGHDKVTTGAAQDIKFATYYAKHMVVSWGLSEKIGPVYHADKLKNEDGYMPEAASEETLKIIDSEVKMIIKEAEQRAKKFLEKNKSSLEKLAKALLEFETLTGEEVKDLLSGKKIRKNTSVGKGKKLVEGLIPKFTDKSVK